jgi:hypothetical protein
MTKFIVLKLLSKSEESIKMDIKEMGFRKVDAIQLAPDRF